MADQTEHALDVDLEVDESNYEQFLTPERDPLPDDSFGEPAPETDDDLTDEEALAGRDDFDDDDEADPTTV